MSSMDMREKETSCATAEQEVEMQVGELMPCKRANGITDTLLWKFFFFFSNTVRPHPNHRLTFCAWPSRWQLVTQTL